MFTTKETEHSFPVAISSSDKYIFVTKDKNVRGVEEFETNSRETFQLLPDVRGERDSIFIAGPTGCGKTRFSMEYLSLYKELNPNNSVFIITSKPSDSTINRYDFDFNILKIDEDYLVNPVDIREFKNAAVFFDDIDYVENQEIRKYTKELARKCIGIGREFGVTVLITSHLLTDYLKTRFILNDCKYVVMFPNCGLKKGVTYFLKEYMSLDRMTITQILKLPSDWIVLHTRAPQFILYETGGAML